MIRQRKGKLIEEGPGLKCSFCAITTDKLYGSIRGWRNRLYCYDCMIDPKGSVEAKGKVCAECLELKPIAEYYHAAGSTKNPDSYQYHCIPCERLRVHILMTHKRRIRKAQKREETERKKAQAARVATRGGLLIPTGRGW